MESSGGEPVSGTEELHTEESHTEEVQSEFFFDKTEYHKIMAEAIATEPAHASFDSDNPISGVVASAAKTEKYRRQTFYVGAFIFGAILLVIGGILFVFG